MSIKTRFLLSYIAVMLIAILLFLAAGFLFSFAVTGDVRAIEHFYKKSYVQKPLTSAEESAFLDLKLLAKRSPEQLLDREQLQKIEAPTIEIAVRKGQHIIYTSKADYERRLLAHLPGFEATNINTRDTIMLDNAFYTYVKFDFYFSDQTEGSIFVLRKVSSYTELTRELLPILLILLFVIFMLIIGLLNYVVSRSIVKPISSLKEGAERIKSGDLDFEIVTQSKDEIGQLNRAFEEMRIKLKESVQLQLQYEENRKELLSNISHDLKTPITAIIGYVEGIKDGVANTEEKMAKYLTTIHTKAKDMDVLIDELFLFSKLDLKKVPFTMETIDLQQYMRDFVEEVNLDLVARDIQLQYRPLSSSLYVKADRDKLRRVLTNLVNNSAKYMDKQHKQITITLYEKADEVVVEVKDNGAGIEATALPHIFDRFYRAEKSRNSETGGSGLGLAIAKQIVLGMSGTIWATSELTKGTSLFISLNKGDNE
ncbi:sensor histidine kinase [Lysinibacillus piscis]|uniref:histidine kinase n=1 Tax=Lysinibacillus piscis TaxID=2518931 RepID=A0ABQ5NL28_9BACI|nr:HAMP domain-containing sensor histidine kinase [Lysinibacillus sp. KH24]GLC88806.1 two-component sensor histidine kinase [Lysinibacillus sp. KH24]